MNETEVTPNTGAWVFWIDEQAHILDVNQEACRALGYSREELLGMSILDLNTEYSPHDWPKHWRMLRQAKTQRFHAKHRRRDGSQCPIEVVAHYFEIAGCAYNCALAFPLTPGRETENALRESEERLSLALSVAGQGLYDWDIASGKTVINESLARMLGYAPADIEVTPSLWKSWLHPDERDLSLYLVRECIEGRRDGYELEQRLCTRRGDWIWVLSAGRAVQRDAKGRATRMLGTLLDITERKHAEARLKRHLDIEQAATEISALMINPEMEDLDRRLHWILERIGRLTQAERSYLLTIAPDPSAPANVHEWCDTNAQPDSETIRTFKTEDLRRVFDATPQDRVVRIRYSDLPDDSPYRPYLRQGKVRSALWVPIELNGRIRGLIGLDTIDHERDWGDEDARLLRMAAEILAHTLQHIDSDRRLKDNARFLEDLDRISRILTTPRPDDELMRNLLDTILDIFQADRAFFMYPGDTGTTSFHIPIEATRPEWPGVTATEGDIDSEGVKVITDTYFYEMVRCLMNTPGPHTLPATEEIRNSATVRRYDIRSQLTIALHPRSDRTWILGLHQCSHERDWSETEQRLFQAIAERVGDELSQHLLLKRLRESEHRFATAFRSNPAAMAITTLDEGRLIDANERWIELTGLRSEDLTGTTTKELGLWVDPELRDRMTAQLRDKGPFKDVPLEIMPRDGERRTVLWSAEIIALGAQPALLSLVQDQTLQRRAEQALQESEQRYRTIFESVAVSLWEEDISALNVAIEDMKAKGVQDIRAYLDSQPDVLTDCIRSIQVVDVNQQTLKMFGADSKEALLGALPQIWLPESRPAFQEIIAAIAEGQRHVELETVNQTLQGERRDILLAVALPDQEAAFANVLVSMIDITERKKAEKALRLAEISIMRSADAVFWVTPDGRLMNVNEQACELLGYQRDELLGMGIWDIDPELSEAEWPSRWELTRHLQRHRFERTNQRKDGTVFPIEVTANYFVFDGQEYDFAFVRDISDRKQADAELRRHREHLEELVNERTSALQQAMSQLVQSEKLAALGKLVAGVAHELNTPLGNARIVASTLEAHLSEIGAAIDEGALRRSQLTAFLAHAREAVDLLERNTSRAAELIGHFKQVAVDQTSMRRRRFNLRQTLNEMLVTLHPGFKHTTHHIEIEAPPELEMDSYPGPLEQVITNLVTNALKHGFAESESGRIRIQAHAEGTDAIGIRCSDDGIGIAPELLDRIFEPFFTTRLGEGGSGLGLYITYNLVTVALGGRIVVDSQPGQGTTFTLTLPRVGPDGQTP
ncbi:PAS domain S-box protein [Thiorhodococcus fuscus]|uniref:histidine kinase n=1 Tax=Thiorhodococcus fuscus TaxID=527200 RepID=A0ABW4YCA1_9GAMM